MRLPILWMLLCMVSLSAWAVEPEEKLPDPVLEQRARALSVQLRCVVCQSENIDDSNAAIAKDLRRLVRERLVAGDSDQQVLDYMVHRYGEFVLLQPRWQADTIIVWIFPGVLLLAGGWIVWRNRKKL